MQGAAQLIAQQAQTDENLALEIECIAAASSAMADGGDKQAALRLLQQHEDKFQQLKDPEARESWLTHYHWLSHQLGGSSTKHKEEQDITGKLLAIADTWLNQERQPDQHALALLQEHLHHLRQTLDTDEHDSRLGLVLGLLRVINPQDNPEQWQSLMQEAEQLAKQSSSEKLKLEQQLILARYSAIDSPTLAINIYATNWSSTQKYLDANERLSIAGFYLECFSKTLTENHFDEIYQLVEEILPTFQQLIIQQPTSLARKRIREIQQRTIEGCIGCLLIQTQNLTLSVEQQQQCYKQAWHVFLLTRNIELGINATATDDVQRNILENQFEHVLRHYFSGHETDPSQWQDKLNQLLEYELAHKTETIKQRQQHLALPCEGLALGFFQFKESSQDIVVMMHYQDQYSAYLVESETKHYTVLKAWRSFLDNGMGHQLPDVLRNKLLQTAIALFQPTYLTDMPSKLPWYVYADGEFNEYPIELLPTASQNEYINQQHAIQFVLSQRSHSYHKIDFSRGVLAVAQIPAMNGFQALPGTDREISLIQSLLATKGFNTSTLTAKKANFSHLCQQLKQQPAVIHLAMHGLANRDFPEACGLVLANDPKHASGEFLLFRQIQQLDCRNIQLAVLSACSSSIGKSSRSAGLQGLVWAFLQAGTQQVIASRYPVNDQASAEFMHVLYQNLLTHDVMTALQQARETCLDNGMSIREVAAWGCWA